MPDTEVEQIKSKLDIVSFIGERIQLKKSGRNYKGLCPFHGEKTPSFFVSPDMQMYKCFGCGAAGDVFSFLQNYESLTFPEALEQLADKAGVTLTKRERTGSDIERDRLLELLHLTAEYYHYLLLHHPLGKPALRYLKTRQITNQTIADWKLGYAPDSWQALQDYLIKKKGFTAPELNQAGLTIQRTDDARRGPPSYYDRFRGRLMFPLTTYAGKIVGFSGRILDQQAKEAKYINSPETSLYHKSEMLFGIHLAKKTIRDKNRIIIVEGEFDVLSSHQIGLKETVAIKGSAFTDDQASLIRRLTKNVILALDADAAGQEAMKRAITVAEKQALDLRVVTLSSGKDPDELAKSDPAALKSAVTAAESVFTFLITAALNQTDTATGEGKQQVIDSLVPELAKIEGNVKLDAYKKRLAKELHISEESINAELNKFKTHQRVGTKPVDKTEDTEQYPREIQNEREILGLLIQSHDAQTKANDLEVEWFSEPHLQNVLRQIKAVAPQSLYGESLVTKLPIELQPLCQALATIEANFLIKTTEELDQKFHIARIQLIRDWGPREKKAIQHKMLSEDKTTQDQLRHRLDEITGLLHQVEGGRT